MSKIISILIVMLVAFGFGMGVGNEYSTPALCDQSVSIANKSQSINQRRQHVATYVIHTAPAGATEYATHHLQLPEDFGKVGDSIDFTTNNMMYAHKPGEYK